MYFYTPDTNYNSRIIGLPFAHHFIFHCASKGHERTSYFPEITQLIVASIHREVDFKSVHFECGSLGESFLLDMGEKLTLVDFFSKECSQIIYLRL